MKTKRKRSRRSKTETELSVAAEFSAQPKLSAISDQIHAFNKRNEAIQNRLGVINAESAKLWAEQHGNDIRKLELMREHDSAAKG